MYFHIAVIPTLKINNNFFKISNTMSTWNSQLSPFYGPHSASDYVSSLLTHKMPLWYFPLFPFLLIYLSKKPVHLSPQNFSGFCGWQLHVFLWLLRFLHWIISWASPPSSSECKWNEGRWFPAPCSLLYPYFQHSLNFLSVLKMIC